MKGRKTGGRQRGTRNKLTQAIITEAAESGLLPKDLLLHWARIWHQQSCQLLSEYLSSNPADRPKLLLQLIRVSDLAKEYMTRAAPYFSPRLMAIESKADPKVQMNIVVSFIKPERTVDVAAEALEAEPDDYRLIAS